MTVQTPPSLEAEASTSAESEALECEGANESSTDDGDNQVVGSMQTRTKTARRTLERWAVFLVLPLLAIAAAGLMGYFKYIATTATPTASTEAAVAQARETTVAMLVYQPATVGQTLSAASQRLTGEFRDEYTKLMKEVVIPGAKANKVTTAATVPAAAVIRAEADTVVALLYVDQHVTIGTDPPTDTATTVKVTLHREGSTWLVSGFEPV